MKKYFKTKYENFVEGNKLIIKNIKKLGFKGVIEAIFKDIFTGFTWKQAIYLIVLSLCPLFIELYYNHKITDWTGLIAATSGIMCVIYVTFGRASNYFWGTINCIIYLILSLRATFYGEVVTTIYFTIMQPIGLWIWLVNSIKLKDKKDTKELKKEIETEEKVEAKSLSLIGWIKYIAFTAVIWLGMGYAYKHVGAARPFRDSITDGTNYTGQLLMNNLYWEQWLFWIATNVFSIYLWWGSNLQMQGMYWVYGLNSIVGMILWLKNAKKNKRIKNER